MKMIFSAVIVTGLALNSFYVSGQDSIKLSLDSAINHALLNNKTLLNAKYASQKTHEKIWETTAAGLPQVTAEVDYTNYLGDTTKIFGRQMFNPTSNLTFNVNQLIFSGSYIVGLQLAKLASQTSELTFQKSELEVKEQVARAYFLVLVAERTVEIMEANKLNTQLVYEKTNNLAKVGMIEQTEADKLLVMVSSIENAQKSAERQLEMAYNMLRLQLGLNVQSKIKLITSLEDISQQNKFETTLTSTFNVDNNYDYKLILMQEKISLKQVSLEKASYLPTLIGYYSHTEKLIKPEFLDLSPKNLVGLKLSIPIFSGSQRMSKVKQSKIDLHIAENSKNLASEQLQIQEKQLRFNLNNMLEQYQNQKMNVEVAKEVFNKMTLKYEQGIVSSLELTSANSNYLTAESNYTNMLFQLLDAELALRKLNGNL
jgi:outer membrane protein TolC